MENPSTSDIPVIQETDEAKQVDDEARAKEFLQSSLPAEYLQLEPSISPLADLMRGAHAYITYCRAQIIATHLQQNLLIEQNKMLKRKCGGIKAILDMTDEQVENA